MLWLLGIGCSIIVLQQAAWKLTGVPEAIFGQRPLLFATGVIAYLLAVRSVSTLSIGRVVIYGMAGLAAARVAVEIPIILTEYPREFDFLAFYLDGNIASAGLNLYDPQSYRDMAAELGVSYREEFRLEVIEVGTKYPPPTAMLFMPLALLEFDTGFVVWTLGTVLLLVILCVILARLFDARDSDNPLLERADRLALATLLVMSVPFWGTGLTHGQTTGLLSILIVLVLLGNGTPYSGIGACLTMWVKPFAVFPSLILLIGRYWAAVIAGTATGVILLAASLVLLGTDDWGSYLGLEFANSSPAELYFESGNYSLLAVLTRAFDYSEIPWGHPGIVWTYASISVVVAAGSLWLALGVARRDFRSAYCLLLMAILIVYPGTIITYAIVLSVPLAVEINNQGREGRSALVTGIFALLENVGSLVPLVGPALDRLHPDE